MRHRLFASLCSAALATGFLGSGAAFAEAKKPTAYLVLSSTGSASTVVQVTHTIRVGRPFDAFPATFTGNFVGYVISSLDGQPLLGRALVRHVGFDIHDSSTPLWFVMKDLPSGRYRVTVLGAGPLRVSIPIGARDDQQVTVRGQAHAFARLIRPSSGELGPLGTPMSNFGVAVPPGHYLLGSVTRFVHGDYTQADVGDECFTVGRNCGDVPPQDEFFSFGNTGEAALATGWSTTPMAIESGVSAVFDDVNAGLAAKQAGLVVLIADQDQ